jgi:hypothetical protein
VPLEISRRERGGAEIAEATGDCRPSAGYMDREEAAITNATRSLGARDRRFLSIHAARSAGHQSRSPLRAPRLCVLCVINSVVTTHPFARIAATILPAFSLSTRNDVSTSRCIAVHKPDKWICSGGTPASTS